MRVSQKMMYSTFINNMNSNLSSYLNTAEQNASQKRINRPSDDPVGAARVLNYRSALEQDAQFATNIDTAKGWLNLTDDVLTQTSTILSKVKALTEQAATGTLTDENRYQISFELRGAFEQLINLSNNRFAGYSLFAGQKYTTSAFESGLSVTTDDANLANVPFQVEGKASRTLAVRFPNDGVIPPVGADLDFEYTNDGGKTWLKGTVAAGTNTLDMDGVRVTVPTPPGATMTAYDPDEVAGRSGSFLYVRPAAIYKGYDNSSPPKIDVYGNVGAGFTTSASGTFNQNVLVRFNEGADLNQTTPFKYSYSTDGGRTWTEAKGAGDGAGNARLLIPGGFVDVTSPGIIQPDTDLVVRPQLTALDYETLEDSLYQVNNVGKDVFGGLYNPLNSNLLLPAQGGKPSNLFETLGKLVGYAECNNMQGVGDALPEVTAALEHILTYAAKIGGKENSLMITEQILESGNDNKIERLSLIEDADLTTLTTRLAQRQLAYQAVLQSSSMIMNLNLTKFL